MTRVAAVDCGTNTIKLLVADLDRETGAEHELVREMRMVRLGQDVDRTTFSRQDRQNYRAKVQRCLDARPRILREGRLRPVVDRVFPSIKIDHSHIVYTFSGVRPLPSGKGKDGAKSTGQISRDHQVGSALKRARAMACRRSG